MRSCAGRQVGGGASVEAGRGSQEGRGELRGCVYGRARYVCRQPGARRARHCLHWQADRRACMCSHSRLGCSAAMAQLREERSGGGATVGDVPGGAMCGQRRRALRAQGWSPGKAVPSLVFHRTWCGCESSGRGVHE